MQNYQNARGKKQKEYTMGFQVRMARKKASHPHLNCLLVSSCRRGARPTLPNYVQTMFAFLGLYPLKKGVPSAESSRSVWGLGKGVSGKP